MWKWLIVLSFSLVPVVSASRGIRGGRKLRAQSCRGRKCDLNDSGESSFMQQKLIKVQLKSDGSTRTFKDSGYGDETTWFGEDADASLTLVKRGKGPNGNDLLFASVVDGDFVYQISPNATGFLEVTELLYSEFPREEEPIGEHIPRSSEDIEGNYLPDFAHRSLQQDVRERIDVMVVWTKKAECANANLAYGCAITEMTTANMLGLIDLAIQETNIAFKKSGISTSLNLVHAYMDPNYVEPTSGAAATSLNHLINTADGVLDDVNVKRVHHGADIVSMIIEDLQFCGIAHVGPSMDKGSLSVSNWRCSTGYFSFAHEIGHNLGCLHDKGTTNECHRQENNYGYRDPNAQFRSILAYDCVDQQCDNNRGGGCPRVQRFSNDKFKYNGAAMGDSQHNCAGKINSVASKVAGYLPAATKCIDDKDCNDGDPCSIDTCNTESGECQWSLLCRSGPTTVLETPSAMGPTGSNGYMFKIKAKNLLEIQGFDIEVAVTKEIRVEIYTRPRGYYTSTSSGWTLIQSTSVKGEGGSKRTSLPALDKHVTLAVGSTQSFYITVANAKVKYVEGSAEGDILSQNDDFIVYQGVGVVHPFGQSYSPRSFIGSIRYAPVAKESTASPSHLSSNSTLQAPPFLIGGPSVATTSTPEPTTEAPRPTQEPSHITFEGSSAKENNRNKKVFTIGGEIFTIGGFRNGPR